MPEKLIAVDGTRTYSFYLINRDASHIGIEMYNTNYLFVKKDDSWINHTSNKMDMAPNLIASVLMALD